MVNATSSDYINASTVTDSDPRNPSYIVTQAPLSTTVADFWQMIWEQVRTMEGGGHDFTPEIESLGILLDKCLGVNKTVKTF